MVELEQCDDCHLYFRSEEKLKNHKAGDLGFFCTKAEPKAEMTPEQQGVDEEMNEEKQEDGQKLDEGKYNEDDWDEKKEEGQEGDEKNEEEQELVEEKDDEQEQKGEEQELDEEKDEKQELNEKEHELEKEEEQKNDEKKEEKQKQDEQKEEEQEQDKHEVKEVGNNDAGESNAKARHPEIISDSVGNGEQDDMDQTIVGVEEMEGEEKNDYVENKDGLKNVCQEEKLSFRPWDSIDFEFERRKMKESFDLIKFHQPLDFDFTELLEDKLMEVGDCIATQSDTSLSDQNKTIGLLQTLEASIIITDSEEEDDDFVEEKDQDKSKDNKLRIDDNVEEGFNTNNVVVDGVRGETFEEIEDEDEDEDADAREMAAEKKVIDGEIVHETEVEKKRVAKIELEEKVIADKAAEEKSLFCEDIREEGFEVKKVEGKEVKNVGNEMENKKEPEGNVEDKVESDNEDAIRRCWLADSSKEKLETEDNEASDDVKDVVEESVEIFRPWDSIDFEAERKKMEDSYAVVRFHLPLDFDFEELLEDEVMEDMKPGEPTAETSGDVKKSEMKETDSNPILEESIVITDSEGEEEIDVGPEEESNMGDPLASPTEEHKTSLLLMDTRQADQTKIVQEDNDDQEPEKPEKDVRPKEDTGPTTGIKVDRTFDTNIPKNAVEKEAEKEAAKTKPSIGRASGQSDYFTLLCLHVETFRVSNSPEVIIIIMNLITIISLTNIIMVLFTISAMVTINLPKLRSSNKPPRLSPQSSPCPAS